MLALISVPRARRAPCPVRPPRAVFRRHPAMLALIITPLLCQPDCPCCWIAAIKFCVCAAFVRVPLIGAPRPKKAFVTVAPEARAATYAQHRAIAFAIQLAAQMLFGPVEFVTSAAVGIVAVAIVVTVLSLPCAALFIAHAHALFARLWIK